MTLNTESPSRMVLKDKKLRAFLTAGGTVVAGFLIACLLIRHGVFPVIVGLAFMGAGAFMLFKIRGVTIELDRSAGTIHIVYQGLKSKEERDLQMAQIQKIILRKFIQTHRMTTTNRGGSSSSSTTYHQFVLVLVTQQNEQIPFDFGKIKVGLMNMLTTPEEKIRRRAQEIADFLNVELDAATPSALDVLGAIRDGIAGRFQKAH